MCKIMVSGLFFKSQPRFVLEELLFESKNIDPCNHIDSDLNLNKLNNNNNLHVWAAGYLKTNEQCIYTNKV